MEENKSIENTNFKVCVRCLTYNHALFIEEAMNGFCMQETSFPFVCCVVDDASTDGEPEIIRKYLQEHFDLEDKTIVRNEETDDYVLTFARHKTNHNCFFVVLYLKYNHHGKQELKRRKLHYVSKWEDNCKYIAFCEGDDYWVDKRKLQKQVQVLEENSECVISFCKTIRISALDGELGATIPLNKHIKEGIVTIYDFLEEQFMKGTWTFHILNSMIRTDFYRFNEEERVKFMCQFPYNDMAIMLWCLSHGNGFYLDFIGGRYRTQSGGYNYKYQHDNEFAFSQAQKLINGFKYFDEYSNYKYHKYVKTRIKRMEYNREVNQGRHFVFLKPYYWDIISNFTFIKGAIRNYISENWPSLFKFIIRLNNK